MSVRVAVKDTGTGTPTLIIERGNKRYDLYSRRNPEQDGEHFHETFSAEGAEVYLFIGLGLGYHIAPFLRDPKVKRVVILEPVEELFEAVRGCNSVGELLARSGVELYIGSGVSSFLEALKGRYDLLYGRGYRAVTYPPLRRIFHTQYEEVEKGLDKALSALTGDSMTIGRFARLWMGNFFKNLGCKPVLQPVSCLSDRWQGTAVIAGAGPSLNGTAAELKEKREYFYLIATDASLKPLLGHDVRPDLVVSCDPQPEALYHVHGLWEKGASDIPAVLNPLSSPEVFRFFTRRYVYFTLHPTTDLFRSHIPGIDDLVINYQAVSSLAFHLALSMGFRTICLAGLDFSFPGMHAYAWNSFFYEYCVLRGERLKPPYTIESGVLFRRGDRMLQDYRAELERMIAGPAMRRGVRVLNLSKKGLDIEGAPRTTALPPDGRPSGAPGEDIAMWENMCEVFTAASQNSAEGLAPVVETLALRNRLFRNISSREQALALAEKWLLKRWRGFKV
jgi:hypothetical protein